MSAKWRYHVGNRKITRSWTSRLDYESEKIVLFVGHAYQPHLQLPCHTHSHNPSTIQEKEAQHMAAKRQLPEFREKKLKLRLPSDSVQNSGKKKLKQRPLNVSVLNFGREKCMHKNSTGPDGIVLLVRSSKRLKHSLQQ